MVVPKMVARCTLFNINTVKMVFSVSMTVTTQTAEKIGASRDLSATAEILVSL